MIPTIVALLLQSAPAAPTPAPPTVGDTIWLARTIAVPAGRTVRAPDWEPEGDVELLGGPQVIVRGDSAVVRWPAVAWVPGRHTVEVPGPLLVAASGVVDSLGTQVVTVEVRSVLPQVPPGTRLDPQPPAGLVPRLQRSWWPLAILLGGALLLLLPLHWWWRRRGRPRPAPPLAAEPPVAPLERWARAGERHAVASAVARRLRRRIAALVPAAHAGLDSPGVLAVVARERPDWPHAELAELLAALDRTRFAPDADAEAADVLALDRRAAALEERLRAPAVPVAAASAASATSAEAAR